MLERAWHAIGMLRASRLPPARLHELQQLRLRRLLRHARDHVPFYRELYRALPPDAPFTQLPVVDKHGLRAAGEAAWDGPARADDVWISTSGSTGEPFRFPISPAHDQWRKAQYLRPYLLNGRGLATQVVRLCAVPAPPPWFARLGLLREHRVPASAPPEEALRTLRRTGATLLQGYPSALRAFATWLRYSGERPPALARIFTDSELLTPGTRRLLESVLGAPVIDVFGTFETDNIAWQCEAGAAWHVATDCAVVELLREGAPVGAGENGELVVTVLGNLRSPFIRYKLHDVARWRTGTCGCGSTLPLIEIVTGRSDDPLRLPGGRYVSPMDVLYRLDAMDREVSLYQLRQYPDLSCTLLYVPTTASVEPGNEARLRAALEPWLHGLPLRLRAVPAIERTRAGKLQAFVQDRGAVDG